jgi:hypothetical protein
MERVLCEKKGPAAKFEKHRLLELVFNHGIGLVAECAKHLNESVEVNIRHYEELLT